VQSVDLSAVGTTYCREVLSITPGRRVSVVAAFAVALSGLLPAPHLHLEDARAIVHVHAVAVSHDADIDHHDHVALDHDDHTAARTVQQSYDVTARFVFAVTAVAAPVTIDAPDTANDHFRGAEILPTHDPPLRFTSSPAPPALV